jgi:hypothetical protein
MNPRDVISQIKDRYSVFFAKLGYGCLQHFKHFIDCIYGFLQVAEDEGVSLAAKAMDYVKTRREIEAFYEYYSKPKLLGEAAEKLRAELLREVEVVWWKAQR